MVPKNQLWIALLLLFSACASPAGQGSAEGGPLRVVATTGMIGDVAARLGGEHAQVTTLMGPGVDPHLYKASEGDVRKLAEADLILYNGLHLEGKMGDILVKLARTRPVVAVTEDLPASQLREPPEFLGQYDPTSGSTCRLWAQTVGARRARAGARSTLRTPRTSPTGAGARGRADRARRVGRAADRGPSPSGSACWSRPTTPSATSAGATACASSASRGSARWPRPASRRGAGRATGSWTRKVKAIFVESSVPRTLDRGRAGGRAARGATRWRSAASSSRTPWAPPARRRAPTAGMVRANVDTIVGGADR